MRKATLQKSWMSLIAIISLAGTYNLYESSFTDNELSNFSEVQQDISHANTRGPASSPMVDGMNGGKENLNSRVKPPRAPAQEGNISLESVGNEWRGSDYWQAGKKYKRINDVIVVSSRKAREWGSQVRGHIHNQSVIDVQELPSGESFKQPQLPFSSATFSSS